MGDFWVVQTVQNVSSYNETGLEEDFRDMISEWLNVSVEYIYVDISRVS